MHSRQENGIPRADPRNDAYLGVGDAPRSESSSRRKRRNADVGADPCGGKSFELSRYPLVDVTGARSIYWKESIEALACFRKGDESIGTLLVERDNAKSRKSIADQVGPRMAEKNQNIAVFPSGTTSLDESKPWRWGVFQIAKQYKIPVQPFRLRYEPARIAAFIDKDAFLFHLWSLLSSTGGQRFD